MQHFYDRLEFHDEKQYYQLIKRVEFVFYLRYFFQSRNDYEMKLVGPIFMVFQHK